MFGRISKALQAFLSRRDVPGPARPTSELERLQSDIAKWKARALDYERLGCLGLARDAREQVKWYRKLEASMLGIPTKRVA